MPPVGRPYRIGRCQDHQTGNREEGSRQSDLGQCPHSIDKDSEAWAGEVNFPITQLEVTELEFSPRLPDSDSMPLHHNSM